MFAMEGNTSSEPVKSVGENEVRLGFRLPPVYPPSPSSIVASANVDVDDGHLHARRNSNENNGDDDSFATAHATAHTIPNEQMGRQLKNVYHQQGAEGDGCTLHQDALEYYELLGRRHEQEQGQEQQRQRQQEQHVRDVSFDFGDEFSDEWGEQDFQPVDTISPTPQQSPCPSLPQHAPPTEMIVRDEDATDDKKVDKNGEDVVDGDSGEKDGRRPRVQLLPPWLVHCVETCRRSLNINSNDQATPSVEIVESPSLPSLRFRRHDQYHSTSSIFSTGDKLDSSSMHSFASPNSYKTRMFTVRHWLFQAEHSTLLNCEDEFGNLYMLKAYNVCNAGINAVRKEMIVQANEKLSENNGILKCIGCFVDGDYMFIIFEKTSGRTLYDVIFNTYIKNGKNDGDGGKEEINVCEREDICNGFTKQILNALITCHKLNVAHRAIMPQNLFIGVDGKLKLGNFDRCKRLKGCQVTASCLNNEEERYGSIHNRFICCFNSKASSENNVINEDEEEDYFMLREVYDDDDYFEYGGLGICSLERMPPELKMKMMMKIGNKKLFKVLGGRKQMDMWAFGLTVYEMIYSKLPDEEIRRRFSASNWICFPESPKISDSAKDFIQNLLHRVPFLRMNVKMAMRHPWIRRDESQEE